MYFVTSTHHGSTVCHFLQLLQLLQFQVLLVADDAEIRRLITTTHIVTDKLSFLSESRTMPDLLTRFKVSFISLYKVINQEN